MTLAPPAAAPRLQNPSALRKAGISPASPKASILSARVSVSTPPPNCRTAKTEAFWGSVFDYVHRKVEGDPGLGVGSGFYQLILPELKRP